MKRFGLYAFLVLSCITGAGCAAVLIGAGVGAGIAISQDTAKLEAETDYDRAWKVALRTIDEMGAVTLKDKDVGKIEATVKDSRITAQIAPTTAKTVSIEVKSRKNLLPNLDVAMEIINKINSKL